MPTFTFRTGCLAEAGEQARELGLSRITLFTDARRAEFIRPGRLNVAQRANNSHLQRRIHSAW
jgi:hypothetical protein